MNGADRVAKQHNAALAVWLAARNAASEPPSLARIARVREKLIDPDACLDLVSRNDRVVGMALTEPFRTDNGGGLEVPGWGHISMVFVDPALQGRGVGRELLERIIRDDHWLHLSLWTRSTNVRAQALYRAVGFVPTKEPGTTASGERTERLERRSSPTCDAFTPGRCRSDDAASR
jgi:ribosomal protein S18 acetylase RimI-like enzyme